MARVSNRTLVERRDNMGVTSRVNGTASALAKRIVKATTQMMPLFLVSTVGPNSMPARLNTSTIMARLVVPGMPRNSRGAKAPPSLELLAASGAMMPSGAPLPKRSGVFECKRA